MMRLAFLSLAVVSVLAVDNVPAVAQQAARTIRIVVPFPAGGSADILARLLGEPVAYIIGVLGHLAAELAHGLEKRLITVKCFRASDSLYLS